MKIKVTYLAHSGYFVELQNCCLLFDYESGKIPEVTQGKKLYVFVSHRHEDHFQPAIFALRKYDVTYILSDDISCDEKEDIIWVRANEQNYVDGLKISTYPSSDEGVAFLVEVEGKTIVHAGDLHWWHWEHENSEEENKEAKQLFEKGIAGCIGKQIDVAFLVLDPRLEEQFYWGMDTWMRKMDIKVVFPMHMWGEYSIVQKMKTLTCAKGYCEKIMDVASENQQFTIEV